MAPADQSESRLCLDDNDDQLLDTAIDIGEVQAAGKGGEPVVTVAAAAASKEILDDDGDELDADGNKMEAKSSKSKMENFKYYTSLFLGTLCIVCIFAFLFLVPFVLDPAISTLLHDFVDEPVTCRVSSLTVKHGKSNCLWSSCREGCTADMYQCYQVRVLYTRRPWKNGTTVSTIPENEWIDLSRYDELENKTMRDTPLLVNIKGCGYPPEITCPMFADKYENLTDRGETFPCYYSKVNPWIVLEQYDFNENLFSIIAAISIPNGLFVIGLIVLLFWYCPYCQARCKKYEEQTNIDEKDDDFEDDDDPQDNYQ